MALIFDYWIEIRYSQKFLNVLFYKPETAVLICMRMLNPIRLHFVTSLNCNLYLACHVTWFSLIFF